MSQRKYPDVHYQRFATAHARVSLQSDPDTQTDMLPDRIGSNPPQYQTVPYKPDASGSTYEDPKGQSTPSIDPSQVQLEAGLYHSLDDPDLDDVLEPPSIPRDNPTFLSQAWKDPPIRKPILTVEVNKADVLKEEQIKVLRTGGEFFLSFRGLVEARRRVWVAEDLTQLVWSKPNDKKTDEINVFEILEDELTGDFAIVLKMTLSKETMTLKLVPENTIAELVESEKLKTDPEKAKFWHEAFHQLVKMQLQPKIYR